MKPVQVQKGRLHLTAPAQIFNVCNAQTKKAPVKKPVAKTVTKSKEPETSLTAETAGKFAKDFAKKMYYAIDFEERKSDYTLSIHRWKPYKITKDDGSVVTWYMIDVTLRWQSAQGGWGVTWKDVEYNGLIVCDEFGCEPNMLIKTKTEPSSKGLAILVVKKSPVAEFNDEQKQSVALMDDWCNGVNYVWAPGGCLD